MNPCPLAKAGVCKRSEKLAAGAVASAEPRETVPFFTKCAEEMPPLRVLGTEAD